VLGRVIHDLLPSARKFVGHRTKSDHIGRDTTRLLERDQGTRGGEETMAEILLLGMSHYPPLSGHDDRMIAPPG
jgi:hypothetical protein